MIISQNFFKMIVYIPIVLLIPGPTNTLLFSSGLQVGIRKTIPLVLAETLGYIVAISLWGFSLISVASSRPWVYVVVKVFCAIYILWLAVKIWMHSGVLHKSAARSVSFKEVFIATTMNPKALLFASMLFPAESFRSIDYFSGAILIFIAMVAPIGTVWSCFGSFVTSQRSWAAHVPALLRSASLVLIFFSGSLAYSIIYH